MMIPALAQRLAAVETPGGHAVTKKVQPSRVGQPQQRATFTPILICLYRPKAIDAYCILYHKNNLKYMLAIFTLL